MIIGFAHLAINTKNLKELETLYLSKGYKKSNSFFSVKNNQSKKAFCNNFEENHDLVILDSYEEDFSLELTCHGQTDGKNEQLEINNGKIIIKTSEVEELTKFFLNGIGFKKLKKNYIKLESIKQSWCCDIQMHELNTDSSRVDAEGPSCLAFYSTNILNDKELLISEGATNPTNIFNLSLGVKSLDIFMARAPGGVLVELIQIKKKNAT